MDIANLEDLSAAHQLTLAYLSGDERAALSAGFALDQRLSRIVRNANEPILAQMRISWWREMLNDDLAKRPKGDVVLASIGTNWLGREGPLIQLADAWEELLVTETLGEEAIDRISQNRSAFIVEAVGRAGDNSLLPHLEAISKRWALVDLAVHCSSAVESKKIMDMARAITVRSRALPRKLRGIAVLDALVRHSLKHGARPLAEGRIGALVAFRAGLIGQ